MYVRTFQLLHCFFSSFALPAVVIDSYPPGTTVEQGESIVLVCRVVGVLPVTLSYSWTCNCNGTEVVSGNRLRIGAISNSLHGGMITCSVTGSGVSVSGIFTLTVTGEKKYSVYLQNMSNVCYCYVALSYRICPPPPPPPKNRSPWNQNSNQIGSPRNQFGCCNWPPSTILVPPP